MKLRICLLTYFPDTPAVSLLSKALRGRQHELIVVSPLNCSVTISRGQANLMSEGAPIRDFEFVLTRCVSHYNHGRHVTRNLEAACATALVQAGAQAINDSHAKAIASDKALSLIVLAAHDLPVPPSVFSINSYELLGSITPPKNVIKLSEGLWGQGVMLTESQSSFRSVSDAFISQGYPLVVQPFLLQKSSRQLRVLVLGGEAIAAYESKPLRDDFRSNLHSGAEHIPVTISSDFAELAVASTECLKLDFAGVDLIVNDDTIYVLEVNPVPGFAAATKELQLEEKVVDFLERRYIKGLEQVVNGAK